MGDRRTTQLGSNLSVDRGTTSCHRGRRLLLRCASSPPPHPAPSSRDPLTRVAAQGSRFDVARSMQQMDDGIGSRRQVCLGQRCAGGGFDLAGADVDVERTFDAGVECSRVLSVPAMVVRCYSFRVRWRIIHHELARSIPAQFRPSTWSVRAVYVTGSLIQRRDKAAHLQAAAANRTRPRSVVPFSLARSELMWPL